MPAPSGGQPEQIAWTRKTSTDPDAICDALRGFLPGLMRVILATGRMARTGSMANWWVPVIGVDARQGYAVLRQRNNKTDGEVRSWPRGPRKRNDEAAMLADLARTVLPEGRSEEPSGSVRRLHRIPHHINADAFVAAAIPVIRDAVASFQAAKLS